MVWNKMAMHLYYLWWFMMCFHYFGVYCIIILCVRARTLASAINVWCSMVKHLNCNTCHFHFHTVCSTKLAAFTPFPGNCVTDGPSTQYQLDSFGGLSRLFFTDSERAWHHVHWCHQTWQWKMHHLQLIFSLEPPIIGGFHVFSIAMFGYQRVL